MNDEAQESRTLPSNRHDSVARGDFSSPAWAQEIYANALLPDSRLRARLIKLSAAIANYPEGSLLQACPHWAQAKGAYRFIENKRIMPEHLLDPLSISTASRCAGLGMVLAVQDTTTLTFPKTCHMKGLGRINASKNTRGMLTHSCLAVGLDGVVRGILHLQSWCREEDGTRAKDRANLPIEEKESIRWLDTARAAHAALERALRPGERPRICHVGDRENDIHEFFALMLELGDAAVVRCARNRRVETQDGRIALAHASISQSPCRGAIEVNVPRHNGQPARKVLAEIRFEKQTLKPAPSAPLQRGRGQVPLWLVEVRETGEPPKGVEPLHWMLWTTEPVASLEQALRIVEIYRLRWRIEDYHRALKEGCQLEKIRFETAHRLELAVALYAPVAARIVEIRDTARLRPDAPCTILFTETEWRVLWTMKKKQWPANDQSPPSLEQAVRWTGSLGGHLGRKGDAMPGTKSIWRGLAKLSSLTEYEAARRQLIDQGPST